jgi:myb proto-oncogene protein
VTFGGDMEDEIDMLLRQIRSFEEEDDSQLIRLSETAAAAAADAGSWSSCSTPGVDSVFQDYVQQGFGQ